MTTTVQADLSAKDTLKAIPRVFSSSYIKYVRKAAIFSLIVLASILAIWLAPKLIALAATTKIGAAIVNLGSTLASYAPAWLSSFVGYIAHFANAYVNNAILLLGQFALSVVKLSSVGYVGTFVTGAAINLAVLFASSSVGVAIANTLKAVVPNLARSLANTVKDTFNRAKDAAVERWNRTRTTADAAKKPDAAVTPVDAAVPPPAVANANADADADAGVPVTAGVNPTPPPVDNMQSATSPTETQTHTTTETTTPGADAPPAAVTSSAQQPHRKQRQKP